MLDITSQLRIPDEELTWTFVRAGGPGGQNVNKVASKAVLRWNVAGSSLPAEVKGRLSQQQQNRLTGDGDLLLTSQRFRDQERNRQDCLDKLRAIVLQALARPKPRRPTRPTRGSKEARLQQKRRRAATKRTRRRPAEE
jgi:ribosome-associated protein